MISETGMQQQFCLRWNNHKTNLLTVLGEQFRNEYFTDVTLACEGGSFIKCHKMVLAACSTYFQCLFSELQCRHPVVVLKDVRYAEIQAILEYMYKGEVSITQEEVEPLLKVAEALKVKGLVGENHYKGQSPADDYNAISTSSAFGGAAPQRQSPQHLRRHSAATEQPVGTPRTGTPSPDDLSNSGGAGSSGQRGGRDSSSTSSSEASRETAAGPVVKLESQENASPPHSTGVHASLHQRSTPYAYGRAGSAPDKSAAGPLQLPIWPISALPMNTPHTTQSIATSMFRYDAVFAAAGNAEVVSPLRRKKLSGFYSSSRDTPILRTVLGQGQADSSQPMSLVCHNDGPDQMPQSNGPTTPQDGSYNVSYNVEMNETMHSPSSSPQSFYSDSKGGVSSAIATYVPSQKPEWKRYKQYTRTDILSAIDAVRNGMSALQAARKYGVPSRTLYDKVKKLGITTQRPFKRSNGSNGAAFPYGISGTGGAMMFGLAGDEEGGVPGALLEQQGLLQHALELGNKIKLENVTAEREAMSTTPPLPPSTPTPTAGTAGSFSQNLLQRALEIEERMKGELSQPAGNPTSPAPTNDHRSPSPNQLIKYAQRSRSLTPSPQPQPDDDDIDDDYEDQVEDLSMSRKPEQQSRVIMPPMNQATAAAMLATCSDRRD